VCTNLAAHYYYVHQLANSKRRRILSREAKRATTFIVSVIQRLKTNIKEETLYPHYDNALTTRVATQFEITRFTMLHDLIYGRLNKMIIITVIFYLNDGYIFIILFFVIVSGRFTFKFIASFNCLYS
jgi:hypothetical protein